LEREIEEDEMEYLLNCKMSDWELIDWNRIAIEVKNEYA